MGFLDHLIGVGGEHAGILQELIGAAAQQGGHADSPDDVQNDPHALAGGIRHIIGNLQSNGLGDTANSWMQGENTEGGADPNAIQQALGGIVDKVAERTGIDRDTIMGVAGRFLPQMVDKFSPNGKPPEAHEVSHFLPDDEQTVET